MGILSLASKAFQETKVPEWVAVDMDNVSQVLSDFDTLGGE